MLDTRQRICVLSEDLWGPPDEGVKKTALALAAALRRQHDVALVSTSAAQAPVGRIGRAGENDVRLARAPRTFISRRLRSALADYEPQVCIYVARASTTLMSFIRCRVLKAYCPQARLVLVGLQARRHAGLARPAIRRLAPELVCVQSRESEVHLQELGCRTLLLPSGVDSQRFQPPSASRRRELRRRYGLPVDGPVVLHVGHLKAARGVRVLARLTGFASVVLVASTSTAQETALADELRLAGVRVLTEYQPRIEELYQAADHYVFPVQSTDNAIEVPLSVLEALASDLPVVSTRFGGLPRLFGGHTAELMFVDSHDELVAEAARRCGDGAAVGHRVQAARDLALPYSWEVIAERLLNQVFETEARRA